MTNKQAPQNTNAPTIFAILWPMGLLILANVSLQTGASLAKTLFSQISPQGVTTLRLGFAACMMAIIFRIWRQKVQAGAWPDIIAYGISLAGMNAFFYFSIARIPIGIAVALEFLGPLCLVLFYTRTYFDAIWALFAIIGLFLLSPLSAISRDLDTAGVVLAILAGVFWATYIIFGQRAGKKQGANVVAFGTAIATLCVLPFGMYSSGWQLLSPEILPTALAVALFASAIPYSFQIVALTRMPQQTFGILMSLEPVAAAIIGSILLNEYLSSMQWMALLAISIASVGSTLTRIQTRAR